MNKSEIQGIYAWIFPWSMKHRESVCLITEHEHEFFGGKYARNAHAALTKSILSEKYFIKKYFEKLCWILYYGLKNILKCFWKWKIIYNFLI